MLDFVFLIVLLIDHGLLRCVGDCDVEESVSHLFFRVSGFYRYLVRCLYVVRGFHDVSKGKLTALRSI